MGILQSHKTPAEHVHLVIQLSPYKVHLLLYYHPFE
uniref:Uncharacterized protein n=1 Tax=Rhizophora mucronata TaxID=61149 RepID=A0A2P2JI98_RHIMU